MTYSQYDQRLHAAVSARRGLRVAAYLGVGVASLLVALVYFSETTWADARVECARDYNDARIHLDRLCDDPSAFASMRDPSDCQMYARALSSNETARDSSTAHCRVRRCMRWFR